MIHVVVALTENWSENLNDFWGKKKLKLPDLIILIKGFIMWFVN